jgi:ectoine hydroxylase-related dioxygenase (phytanoyl-CoA dioxygenase family)
MKAAVKRLVRFFRESPVAERPAVFERAGFLAQASEIQDPIVKEHVVRIVTDGYTVIRQSVDNSLIDDALTSFHDWKSRNRDLLPQFYKFDDKLDRIINIQDRLGVFKQLFTRNRTALAVQDYLFQGETCLYTSLFFEVGTQQSVHRDIPLFWTKPANYYFGTWLALEDTDAANGPLLVVPGSHKLPLLDREAMARRKYANLSDIKDIDDDLWEMYQSTLQTLCSERGLPTLEVHVHKGDTIIWHPLLVHGGAAITDKTRTRKSFIVHTTPSHVPVFHNDVFFDPKRRVRSKSGWRYETVDGRTLTVGKLSIGHGHDFDFRRLA